jgi:hypothetical protein
VPVEVARERGAHGEMPPSIPAAGRPALKASDLGARETKSGQPGEWSLAKAQALAEVIGWTAPSREQSGSAEIADVIRGPIARELPPGQAPLGAAPAVPAESQEAISSPPGGELPARQGFWLNVNAELLVYGATEPDAQVVIGGRPIRLRPDGTFSCRLALPDGHHQLSVAAVSPRGDARGAELEFYRDTKCHGQVGEAARDPSLSTPSVGEVS